MRRMLEGCDDWRFSLFPLNFFLFAQKFFFLFKVPSCCFAIGRANSNTAAVESLQGFIMHGQCIETDHSPSESTHEARGHAPTLISSNLTSKKGGSHILESGAWKLLTNQKCCSLLLNFSSNQCLATRDPKGGKKIPDSFSKDRRRGRSHVTQRKIASQLLNVDLKKRHLETSSPSAR